MSSAFPNVLFRTNRTYLAIDKHNCEYSGRMDTRRRSGFRICLFLMFLGIFCQVDARLTLPPDYEGQGGFGTAVAVSLNDELAVSAPDTRAIFIYKQGDNMTWSVTQVITLDQGSESDQFGAAILFGNNFLFIGAPGVLNNAGEVYVYSKVKTDKWEFIQKVNPSSTGSDRTTTFGSSISVSNQFLAVAASSSVFVFQLNETASTWGLFRKISNPGFRTSRVIVTDSILFATDAKNQLAIYLVYNNISMNFDNQRLVNRPASSQSFGSGLAYFGGNFFISAPNVTINQTYYSQIIFGYINMTTYDWVPLDKWTREAGSGLLLTTSINDQRLFIASNYSVALVNDISNPDAGAVFDINGVTSADSDSKGFAFFGVAGAVHLFQYDSPSNSWTEIDGNAPIMQPVTPPVNPPNNDLALGLGLGLPLGLLAAGAALLVVLLMMRKRKQKKKKAEEARKAEQAKREATAGLPRVQSQYNALPAAINASESDPMANTINASNAMTETMALDRLNVPYASLKFNEEIGVGAFGKVFLGEWEHAVVALKIGTVVSNQAFFDEAKLMVELRPHPNIVQMYGVSIDGPYPVMILEYCDGGSLDKRLFTKNSSLGQRDELDFAFGIAKGLSYLHKNGIVHRDLAVRNVLLLHGVPKISDFGMSRAVGQTRQGTTKSTVGPIRWMAPESLKTKEYSHFSDVWSYGITLYEIVARQEPHNNEDELNIAVKIRDENYTPTVPEHCNPFLKSLMERCWNPDPEKRPTMDVICNEFQEYLSSNQA